VIFFNVIRQTGVVGQQRAMAYYFIVMENMAKPKGQILIIGGAEDTGGKERPEMKDRNREFKPFEALQSILPSNGSKRSIEVVTTASSDVNGMSQKYRRAFKKIGFTDVGFLNIQDNADANNEKFVKRVKASHAVFFTGGNQFTLAAILGGSNVLKAIKEKYQKDPHFVLAGTSAGAMAMSAVMIHEGGVNEALLKNEVRISTGLAIFDTCIIDTHFIRRGRFARLVNAVLINPEALGIGLGEDSYLHIRQGGIATCLGSGSVTIIDGLRIGKTNITEAEEDHPLFVENLKVHVLCRGCRFSLLDRQFLGMNPRLSKSSP
jgi:cyanophycinase